MLRLLLVVLICLVSIAPVRRANAEADSIEAKPIYVGVAYGQSTSDPLRIESKPAFLVSSKDDTSVVYSLTVGTQLFKVMAIELSYSNLGDYSFVATSSWRTPTRLDVKLDTTAFDISVPFRLQLRPKFSPIALIGIYRAETDYKVTPESLSSESSSSETIGTKYGVGAEIGPIWNMLARIQWIHYSDVGGVNTPYGKIVKTGYSAYQISASYIF